MNSRILEVPLPDGLMGGRAWGPERAPDLVFLHANGFCGSTYTTVTGALAQEGHAVATLDLRGHGLSRLPADPLSQRSWNTHCADLCAALSVIAPQGCVLAGHSMGGTSALLAAAARPDLVKSLVLFDPVLAPSGFYLYARLPWVFSYWRKHFPMAKGALRRRRDFASRDEAVGGWQGRGAFKSWTGTFLADYARDGLRDRPDGGLTLSCAPEFEASCFAGQQHDPHSALRHRTAPLRVIAAARGSTCAIAGTGAITRAGGTVETWEGTSHFIPMERPAQTIEALSAAVTCAA